MVRHGHLTVHKCYLEAKAGICWHRMQILPDDSTLTLLRRVDGSAALRAVAALGAQKLCFHLDAGRAGDGARLSRARSQSRRPSAQEDRLSDQLRQLLQDAAAL